jgi:hypothetical protein
MPDAYGRWGRSRAKLSLLVQLGTLALLFRAVLPGQGGKVTPMWPAVMPFVVLVIIAVVVTALGSIYALLESDRGRRLVARAAAFIKEWACLLPLLAFCFVVVVEFGLDVWFLAIPSQSHARLNTARSAHLVGQSLGAQGVAPVAPPLGGMMQTLVAATLAHFDAFPLPVFTWASPETDIAAAARVESARYVIEMIDMALVAAAVVTIVYCLVVTYRMWNRTAWKHRKALLIALVVVAGVNYCLWYPLNPLEKTLSNRLGIKADILMGLPEPIPYLLLAELIAIWLISMTSGFIVANEASEPKVVHKKLDQLTVLLYLAAALLALIMIWLVASTYSAASLLAKGKESAGDSVRQLALMESLNFGVFWSFFLAASHYSSVWAVTRKHSADELNIKKPSTDEPEGLNIKTSSTDKPEMEKPTPTRYYHKVTVTLSILSPMIVAILTKLLESLIKG